MKTLYLERSTGSARDGAWTEGLDLDGIERIVVGTGPGSFAGVRAAIAFATGRSVGSGCEVMGLPSPCAIAGAMGVLPSGAAADSSAALAVVGDARRGMRWLSLFDCSSASPEVKLVSQDELAAAVPAGAVVVSPDHVRIGESLVAAFRERYLGERLPTSEGLRAYAEAMPSALVPDPRPIYLSPAVRD